MFEGQRRSRGAQWASFCFGIAVFGLLPSEIGYQDIGALLARQPGIAESYQKHVIASPFGTIHAATFNFARPVGTAVRETAIYQLASLETRGIDVTGSLAPATGAVTLERPAEARVFPEVNRSGKSDREALRAPQPANQESAEPAPPPAIGQPSLARSKSAAIERLDPELEAALNDKPLQHYVAQPQLATGGTPSYSEDETDEDAPVAIEGFSMNTARQFLGSSLGPQVGRLERWQPGEEPVLVIPDVADRDATKMAALPVDPAVDEKGGETVAGKGVVTGEHQRPKTPAERLALDSAGRTKAEKCLAEAVYYEARGEAVRGQIAVAQVVLNRAFSGFYPSTVCGVVYQNKHRWMACQFSFACDGSMRKGINEPDMWERAKKIAREIMDGRLWLPEVGKSTHYHAYWVRPSWVREMRRLSKFGVHTFYRPRAWGDGSEAPSWGSPEVTEAVSAKL